MHNIPVVIANKSVVLATTAVVLATTELLASTTENLLANNADKKAKVVKNGFVGKAIVFEGKTLMNIGGKGG